MCFARPVTCTGSYTVSSPEEAAALNCNIITGDLTVPADFNGELIMTQLIEIQGNFRNAGSSTASITHFPNLEKAGSLRFSGTNTALGSINFDKLREVDGFVYFSDQRGPLSETIFPSLEVVRGNELILSCAIRYNGNQQLTTVSFPMLQSIENGPCCFEGEHFHELLHFSTTTKKLSVTSQLRIFRRCH